MDLLLVSAVIFGSVAAFFHCKNMLGKKEKKEKATQRAKEEAEFRCYCRFYLGMESIVPGSVRAAFERRGIEWNDNYLVALERLGSGETIIPKSWKGKKS